jgi:hypothetical protein
MSQRRLQIGRRQPVAGKSSRDGVRGAAHTAFKRIKPLLKSIYRSKITNDRSKPGA